eukprot:4262643-Amphidinium_carterae.1
MCAEKQAASVLQRLGLWISHSISGMSEHGSFVWTACGVLILVAMWCSALQMRAADPAVRLGGPPES